MVSESEGVIMERAEMRQAKADLHKVIVDEILSKGGTVADDVEMWSYVIELANSEIVNIFKEIY